MDKIVLLSSSGFYYVDLDFVIQRLMKESGLSEEEVYMNLMEPELRSERYKEDAWGWLAEDVCTFWTGTKVGAVGTVLVVPFYLWEDAIEEVAVGKTPSE